MSNFGKSVQMGTDHKQSVLEEVSGARFGKTLARRSLFCLCTLAAAMSFGCSDGDSDDDPTVTPGENTNQTTGDGNMVFSLYQDHDPVERGFKMNAVEGCALDGDCTDGMFCFHGMCTSECSEENPCAKGTCSKNGRCVVKSSKTSLLRDLKEDLDEASKSDVVERIPGAEVLFVPAEKVYVEMGASVAHVTLTTMEDYGTVSYTVRKPVDDTVTMLMQSTASVDSKTGQATYEFELPVKESSLGDSGSVERIILETSVGSYEIALAPRKPASGLYDGAVMADQFAGVSLPIRMIIETTPAQISSFNDIKAINVYLPVSGNDLFTPDIVTDASKTMWSKVEMKQETTNCMDSDVCWSANYSTNDFTFPKSELVDAAQKINRAIRIEINGYDENAMMFDGSLRDILAGVYREVDNTGKMQWAKATMDGTFIVTRKGAFDKDADDYKDALVDHVKQDEELRELDSAAANICSDDDIKALMQNAGEECSAITTLTSYESSEQAASCLMTAVDEILKRDDMVSKIIEQLITKEADDLTPVQGFASLQDFMDDCAKSDGICKGHSEYVCGVDLLGRAYLNSDDTNKEHMLENWHQLLRESYLGRQYSAWQNDVEVRRKWLENIDSPSFLSNVLEKINTNMLQDWEENVFKAHLYVLKQQFNQTSLEVLTRVDSTSTIVSDRDQILAEFADGWSGVSDAMALGLRRYDALYTGTTQRTEKADELRPHLFDLYYAGLVETAINRDTDNGSLNGSYGKNLYENVARLRSLDQSFDDLVFMRDAEVVTSTSLDPLSSNLQVLSDRKKLAKDTVAAAQTKRDKVFDDYDQKKINQAQINATLSNTIDSLQTELVNLCGMPRNEYGKECTDPKDSNCAPRVEPGFCGFDLAYDATAPGDLAKIIDMPVSDNELTNYYSSDQYKVTAEDIEPYMVSESDIKNMSQSDRDALLGLTDSDYKKPDPNDSTKLIDKSEDEINKMVDAKIKAYQASANAKIKLMVTDYYSLTNTGEAAEAILAYRSAVKDVDIAKADFTALSNKVDIARSTCEAYAANIEEWNKKRQELLETVQKNVEVINAHYDNITEAERKKIGEELSTLQSQYDIQSAYVTNWKSISTKHKDDQIEDLNDIRALQNASLSVEYAVSVVDRFFETAATFFEEPTDSDKLSGFSQFGALKGGVVGAGNIIAGALEGANLALNIDQNNTDINIQIEEYNHAYTVELNELNNDLALQKAELDLEESLAKFIEYGSQKACEDGKDNKGKCHPIVSCNCEEGVNDEIYSEVNCPVDKGCTKETKWYAQGLDQWILSEQNAIDTLDEVNDTLRELFEVNDAYERDLQDLAFKRNEYMQMAQDLLVKREQILKAQIQEYSALKHYYTIVQRAVTLESQYKAAADRLSEINNLYSAPASIFSFASDLEVVESKIDLAKERIYDYLAAVEYLAVRPFVDLRRATYLARSTNDLDAIIDQIDTVVSKCGGGTPNTATVEISAREMMGITTDFATMSMAERFQSVIAKGNIPVNSLTRYTVESDVRDLVNKGTDLRSGTFAVTIDKSMNLATTCNAKIDSIAIQIVGKDIIKEGAGNYVTPNITVFYDGQSQLASCQPNIASLVSTIGSKTSYGKYSTFVVEPTKISPTAKINEYGEPNISLAGKPFATSYTVLIDTQIGENSKIDWDKVEDIKLQVRYTYQDLFPNSSACVSL